MDGKNKWHTVRGSPYTASFTNAADPKVNSLTGPAMIKNIQDTIARTKANFEETSEGAKIANKDLSEVKTLIGVKDCVEHVQNQAKPITLSLDQLYESIQFLSANGISKDKEAKQVKKLFDEWTSLKKIAKETKKEIAPLVDSESKKNQQTITKFEETLKAYTTDLKKREFYKYDTGKARADETLEAVRMEIDTFKNKLAELQFSSIKFEHPDAINASQAQIEVIETEMDAMSRLWDHAGYCQGIFNENLQTTWYKTNSDEMEEVVKKLQKSLKEMKVDKKCNTYTGLLEEIKKWIVFLPLVGQLRDQAMRDRHWDAIREKCKTEFTIDDNLLLKFIWDLQLTKIAEDVEEITDQAVQEARMEKQLNAIAEFWKDIKFDFQQYKNTNVQMLRLSEENFETLEENQTVVTAMFSSRYLATFEDTVNHWNKSLASIAEVVLLCGEVQRTWSFLENLFIHSEEVKKELPKQSESFIKIDQDVKKILQDGYDKQIALNFCTQDWVFKELEEVQKQLTVCEKALFDFMNTKRTAFPRFYFVSQNDLLDILSNGNNPSKVMIHMPKIFQAIDTLELKDQGAGQRPIAEGMHASVGKEYVKFSKGLELMRKVENYLQDVIDMMRRSLKDIAADSRVRFAEKKKADWLGDDPAQVTLLVNMVNWVNSVEDAFEKNSMQQAYDEQK